MPANLPTLEAQIAEDAAHLDAAHHRLLANIRLFATDGDWHMQGFRSCAQWLSWRVGWTSGTAREHVRVALALGHLPNIDRALSRGELSYSKVRAVTRVATPDNESVLLEQALLTTGHQLETICRKYAWVQRHDKDAAHPAEDAARRYLTRRDTPDGMVLIEAVLHPDEAAVVWAALERIAADRCRAAARNAASTSTDDIAARNAASISTDDIAARNAASIDVTARNAASTSTDGIAARNAASTDATAACNAASTDATAACNAASTDDVAACNAASTDATAACNAASTDATTAAPSAAAIEDSAMRNAAPTDEPTSHDEPPDDEPATPAAKSSDESCRSLRDVPAGTRSRPAFDRADALVELATAVVRGDRPDRSPTEIMISIPIETLQDTHHTDATHIACCADGSVLSSHAARRLACDAGIIAVIENDSGTPLAAGGTPLAAGRKLRTISGSMKRALLRRDACCRYPGCHTRVFLEGHHIKHWVDGGKTDLMNIVALCPYHHRFVHEYGFTVELQADGTVTAYDERGRAVPERPPAVAAGFPDLGWPHITSRNARFDITAHTIQCWDGTPVDYPELVDWIVRTDERAACAAERG